MDFNDKNGYLVHNGVVGYKEDLILSGRENKIEVWVYFKPLEVLRNENGSPTDYRIYKILDVIEYLKTGKEDSYKEHTYTNLDVPNTVKFIMGS